MKKVWTPEERKAVGDRLRAAKLAKQEKVPVKINQSAAQAGIQQPSGQHEPKGKLIKQLTEDEAIAQLDEMEAQEWVKLHYDQGDFNIQAMANVLRETTQDIYDRLYAMGYELPQGTYNEVWSG